MKSKKNNRIKFAVGDIVKIQSAEHILNTLDSAKKLGGCLFMNQMWNYCGQKFKILKIISNFFDEYRFKMYKTKSTLYILDELICDGHVELFNHKCDRSCYLLWHEKWLSKPED